MKKCSKCKNLKQDSDFFKNTKSLSGLASQCKECSKKRDKEWRKENKEKIRDQKREYRKTPKGREVTIRAILKYKKTDKGRIADKKYETSLKGKKKRKEIMTRYYKTSKGKRSRRRCHLNWEKGRLKRDPLYHLRTRLPACIRTNLNKSYTKKDDKTIKYTGLATWQELLMYMTSPFGGIWPLDKNGDKYEIDHIVPLSFAKKREDMLKLNHYSNLQLLSCRENVQKSNKITTQEQKDLVFKLLGIIILEDNVLCY